MTVAAKDSAFYTLVIRHGGYCIYDPAGIYDGEEIDVFDMCRISSFSMAEMYRMLRKININHPAMRFKGKRNKNRGALRCLETHEDFSNHMATNMTSKNLLTVYVEKIVNPQTEFELQTYFRKEVNGNKWVLHGENLVPEAGTSGGPRNEDGESAGLNEIEPSSQYARS